MQTPHPPPTQGLAAPPDGPLAGLRVLELGQLIAGPFAAGRWPTLAPT